MKTRRVFLVVGVLFVIGMMWMARFVGTTTLLSLACEQDNKPLMRISIFLGADIEAREDGRTALLYAIERNDIGIATHLLEIGANPNVAYPNGLTALEAAKEEGFSQMVALLKRFGARQVVRTIKPHLNGLSATGAL